MNTRGKNINLFLIDGNPNGRMKCTLSNWIGVAYKIPRTELNQCKDRADLKQSGIYFLFGTSEQTGDKMVYIGQASARQTGEGILSRLHEHRRNPEKDYWNEAIIFTTSNNSLGPTEISYLENRFHHLANEAKRYTIKNTNTPSPGNITEEKESELEAFIDYAKVIIGVLGYKIFEPLNGANQSIDTPSNICTAPKLYIKRTTKRSEKAVDAIGVQTSEGFVLIAGSSIEMNDAVSIPASVKVIKSTAKIDAYGVLKEDVLLSSPSAAAAFAIGSSANGLTEWKDINGKTLKLLESENCQ